MEYVLAANTVDRLLSHIPIHGNWQPLAAVLLSPHVCEKQSTTGTKHRQNEVTAPQPEPMPLPQAFLLGITVPSHALVALIISAMGTPGTLWKSSGAGMYTRHLKVATDSRQGAGGGLCEGVSVRFRINTFQMASVAQVCLPHDFGAISHNLHVHHAASGNISSQVQLRELCLEENAKQTNKQK